MTPTPGSVRAGADQTGAEAAPVRTGPSRWRRLVGLAGVVVVIWSGSNILDAINGKLGPGGGGGGQHSGPGGAPSGQSTNQGGDTIAPGADQSGPETGGSPHDPSRYNH